jgi:hypothetical protein
MNNSRPQFDGQATVLLGQFFVLGDVERRDRLGGLIHEYAALPEMTPPVLRHRPGSGRRARGRTRARSAGHAEEQAAGHGGGARCEL